MHANLTPTEICRLLATRERLRVVAALALGAETAEEAGARAGLEPREVAAALVRLTTGGLVEQRPRGRLRLRAEMIAAAARASAQGARPVDHGASDPAEATVLRTFMPGGRLLSLPAARSKRRIVLDHLARAFEPGRRYPEREVNATLRALCELPPGIGAPPGTTPPDHVTLRRLLVDEGFFEREGGVYWRAGGTFQV